MQLRLNRLGCWFLLGPLLACNNMLGLERAEFSSPAAGGGDFAGEGGLVSSSAGTTITGGTATANAGAPATNAGAPAMVAGGNAMNAGAPATDVGGAPLSGGGNATHAGGPATDVGGAPLSGGGNATHAGGPAMDAGGDATSASGAPPSEGGNTAFGTAGSGASPSQGGNTGMTADGSGGAADGGALGLGGYAGGAAGANPGGGACGAGSANAYLCEGATLVWCAGDNPPQTRDCLKAELCDAVHHECDICVADTKTCSANQIDVCDSTGQAHLYTPCDGSTPFCNAGGCVACLVDIDCPSSQECFEPICTNQHACDQKSSNKGKSCSLGTATGACDGNGHCGVCAPEEKRCNADGVPELCVLDGINGGVWQPQAVCASPTPYCIAGSCEPPPSCRGMPAGQAQSCGIDHNQHCCLSPVVPGATYTMGSDDPNWTEPSERPAHDATVGAFRLDAFEVTVGRFRRFIANYQGPPAEKAGADPLPYVATGWLAAWDGRVPTNAANIPGLLVTSPGSATYTLAPADREFFPVNQVSWYLAFAFCAYDGGWLPSEAEWERAATASGDKNFYPWGGSPTSMVTTDHAAFNLACPKAACSGIQGFSPVGSFPLGIGPNGQYDLAGNVAEWTMDLYDDSYYAQFSDNGGCLNCVNVPGADNDAKLQSTRGGNAWSEASSLRITARTKSLPATVGAATIGFRCARPR
jgi:formylglycine-generating enzyme